MLNTPVLFLVFNRLDTTKQVFAKIREIQPKQLFIGADGARAGKEGEAEKVQAVRQYVLNSIDWDCEVKTLFREENLGCGKGVSEAITWFFDNVEQGIILEDDCLPDLSFFTFCEELLNYYKDNERIMHIGGNNYFNKQKKESYYFSKYVHPPHGWASWRRAWTVHDYDMKGLPNFLETGKIHDVIKNKKVVNYWIDYLAYHKRVNLDAWDTQWQLDLWLHNGTAIMPYLNLVANIGYNSEATHTKNKDHKSNTYFSYTLAEIIHATEIKINEEYDNAKIIYAYMLEPTFMDRFKQLIPKQVKTFLKRIYANQN